MLADRRLQHVIQQVRHLLSCGSVHIVLGCTVPELRHPLLNQLSISGYAVVMDSGEISSTTLLQHEQMRALCDVSLYKGQLSASSTMQWIIDGVNIHSIAVAPLEVSPGASVGTGVIGLIICTDACPDAFSYGERLLLQRYLPQITELLAQDAAGCLLLHTQNSITQADGPSTLLAPLKRDHRAELAHPVAPQLKILDPLKNEFISMLSHELRSPLTAIKGYAILLQAYGINGNNNEHSDAGNVGFTSVEELTPMRQHEYLDIIMEQTNHLEVLISDLLDISRMQAGRLALRYTQVNVAELCQRVVQLVQQRADQQYPDRYTFRCTIAPEFPMQWTDAHRMRQILTNLLENAVKYSPEGGLIEILAHLPDRTGRTNRTNRTNASSTSGSASGASSTNDPTAALMANQHAMFAITIRDNGIGIPLQQQPHLFQPFSRLEHPLTHDVQGAGLGLYITHKLVEAMGGTITLQSSEGQGTSMTFLLPINQPENTAFISMGTC